MKVVIVYRRNEGTFEVIDHDVDDQQAEIQVQRLRAGKQEAYAIPQTSPHYSHPDQCDLCTRLATQFLTSLGGQQSGSRKTKAASLNLGGLGMAASVEEDTPAETISPPGKPRLRSTIPYLAGLTLLVIVFILLVGPLAPFAQRALSALSFNPAPTFVPPTAIITDMPASTKTVLFTETSSPAPVATATAANTPTSVPSSTWTQSPIPIKLTATQAAPTPTRTGCTPVDAITLNDVGKTMCVTGDIVRAYQQSGAAYIVFNDQRGTFYMVSYDIDWGVLLPEGCVQGSGEIKRLGNSPIMILNFRDQISACPK
ncbi:MAG: hypothetical protein ACM3PY_21545 [Omnitrophica WOR_2 bacterium]